MLVRFFFNTGGSFVRVSVARFVAGLSAGSVRQAA